ncbi:MerR family transcriptional regulator [Pseudonocardia sp. KRD291]|uniref:MerR family transcriptional regulator n=1 Tax=Pseudonocardia sp. KRD291 TaxID=2792007 RepID=UPI001C4A37A6|nr:MerR family transcriptional regulator [Pseudonocardia sp. KRD291]MBW0105404.1 MerR family transcriptional regulator [Pseudonocardia sp. KRD291]
MELLTIGRFARVAGLTRKALRLYDELDLLRPARTDPVTGYRLYAPDQLERARLVAWLRRAGMPLPLIRAVCDAPAGTAAGAVQRWWATVERDTVGRRDLVAALVRSLSEEDDPMVTTPTPTPGPLVLRCAAGSDRGLVRMRNQDRAAGGDGYLAVSDGFGPGGGRAGDLAVSAVADLAPSSGAASVLAVLEDAVTRIGAQLDGAAPDGSPREVGQDGLGQGATLTALVRAGDSRLALVHVGDSRAYLLREGRLSRLTHDHTLVRSMVDAGTLTEEEAASHPERSTLLRAVTGGGSSAGADLALHEIRAGDRILLCTDGVHTVLPAVAIDDVLRTAPAPDAVVHRLTELALAAGAPDNVGIAVADVAAAV